METRIEARNLQRFFGATCAVENLNLQVAAGEIYGLVGPDGAGKTTTLRLLCGALRPTAGEAFIGGWSMTRQPEQGRTQIGYLAQRFSLYDELTVLENLRFFAEVRGLSNSEWKPRSLEILEFVGLAPYVSLLAGKLSGGMRQKLGLAAALVHRPQVLLLDEPTTGVDPTTRQDFWQLIIRLVAEEQVAVLVTTPYMDEAARCMRLGYLRAGRMLIEGTPTQLRNHLADRVVELRGQPLRSLRTLAGADPDVEDVHMFGDRLHLRIKAGRIKQAIPRLEKKIRSELGKGYELRAVPAQLEDVFIALLDSQESPYPEAQTNPGPQHPAGG